MANIVDPIRKLIFSAGVQFRTAVSEELAQRLGAQLNFHALKQYDVKEFFLNGRYNTRGPQNTLDGLYIFPFDAEIINVGIFHTEPGVSGTTEIDLKIATTSGGSFTSIFTTTPKFDSAAVAGTFALCYDIATPVTGQTFTPGTAPAGTTLGVMSSVPFQVDAGDAIRIDLLQVMVGAPRGTGALVYFRPR